ncbi:MAG TPA: hypothetical protein VLA14_11580 [Polyangia bacterium]|nr:hypothetical protein [Polyangia bacterium]
MILFAANGCGSSGSSSTGTAGAKGSAGTSGSAGSGAAGSAGADGGTAGADSGAAGGGTAGAGDAGATGGAGGTVDAGSAGADGSVAACGTSPAAEIGASCNTVDATGPCVVATLGSGTPPTPGGGPIQGGTYDLTSLTVYPTSDAGVQVGDEAPRRGTLVIPAVTTGTFTIQMTQASGAAVERQAGTVVVVGSNVMFTPTCPPPGDAGGSGGSAGFTATATTFTLFEMGDNGVLNVDLYTKR